MKVALHKGVGRNRLTCWRADGSSTASDVGPGLPAHDLAHLVGERALGLADGFYGLVASGRGIDELADPRRLPLEQQGPLARAETVALALGAAITGSCPDDEVWQLVASEVKQFAPDVSSPGVVAELRALLARWESLPPGGTLVVDWPE